MENNKSPISDFNFKMDKSKFDKVAIDGITFESNTNQVLCDHDVRLNNLKFEYEFIINAAKYGRYINYIIGSMLVFDISLNVYLILT